MVSRAVRAVVGFATGGLMSRGIGVLLAGVTFMCLGVTQAVRANPTYSHGEGHRAPGQQDTFDCVGPCFGGVMCSKYTTPQSGGSHAEECGCPGSGWGYGVTPCCHLALWVDTFPGVPDESDLATTGWCAVPNGIDDEGECPVGVCGLHVQPAEGGGQKITAFCQ